LQFQKYYYHLVFCWILWSSFGVDVLITFNYRLQFFSLIGFNLLILSLNWLILCARYMLLEKYQIGWKSCNLIKKIILIVVFLFFCFQYPDLKLHIPFIKFNSRSVFGCCFYLKINQKNFHFGKSYFFQKLIFESLTINRIQYFKKS
jgi:hypothetical protein